MRAAVVLCGLAALIALIGYFVFLLSTTWIEALCNRQITVCSTAKPEAEVSHRRKTAKALGLTIPPSLLLRADQVIE